MSLADSIIAIEMMSALKRETFVTHILDLADIMCSAAEIDF